MEGMIVLIVLIPLLLLILQILTLNRLTSHQDSIKDLKDHIRDLALQIEDLTNLLRKKAKETKPEEAMTEMAVPPSIVIKPDPVIPKQQVEEPAPLLDIPTLKDFIPKKKYVVEEPPKTVSPKPKSRDMEKYIGENLANKIGIAVLVLGISFFVKYAIDKNWINESGRVLIGLGCGILLIGIAHYIRKKYHAFSSVLVGGGLTVLYFSVAFAFHQYQLMSQQAAFVSMVGITALAVGLSLYYDRKELAILATIGGFITPFLVSTGQNNYIALFTYLAILNSGLMTLAWFKRWPALQSIALFFTTIIYAAWLIQNWWLSKTPVAYDHALLFSTIFYLQFIVMAILNNLRLKRNFSWFDFITLFSINFLYFIAGATVLDATDLSNYRAAFTLALGVFNLVLAAYFYPRKAIDRSFVTLLIGLALTFISLAAPIQFKGNQTVLFWAAESVVLYWIYQKNRIIQLKAASMIVAILAIGTLVLKWIVVYFFHANRMPIILNMGFVSSVVVAVALFIFYLLLKKDPMKEGLTREIGHRQSSNILITTSVMIAYLAGALEIYYQFWTRLFGTAIFVVYLQAYTFAATILILWLSRRSSFHPMLKFLLTGLCFGLYLISLSANYDVSLSLLASNTHRIHFVAHWIAGILLGWLLYDLVRFFFQSRHIAWIDYRPTFTWFATIGIILLLSVECYHVTLWVLSGDRSNWEWHQNLYYKAGLSILWGICSFVMMYLGMRYAFRTLRIISLTLFTVTLVKLFFYDIRNIPPGGKIAAFILLGVLLLTVSFMYQRLKRIIIDNAENDKAVDKKENI